MNSLLKITGIIICLGIAVLTQAQIKRVQPTVRRAPVITKEVSITAPKDNARVTSPLTVTGSSQANTELRLSVQVVFETGEYDLGTFFIKSDAEGNWKSIPVNLWSPENAENPKFILTAIKSGENNATKAHKITVLPPANMASITILKPGKLNSKFSAVDLSLAEAIKPAAPTITSPGATEQVNSPLTIKGKGEKETTIEVDVRSKYDGGEQHLGMYRTVADAQGNWQTVPINLWTPDAAKNITYIIKAIQYIEEKGPSKTATVTVKPPQAGVMTLNKQRSINSSVVQTNPVLRSQLTIPAGEIPIQLDIASRDDMRYDKTEFRIPANKWIALGIKNTGRLPKESMSHNIVILQHGTDVGQLVSDAVRAKLTDYIPAGHDGDILYHSKLLGPGEADQITFRLSDAGVYEFICTFPGHHATEKGKIVVESAENP